MLFANSILLYLYIIITQHLYLSVTGGDAMIGKLGRAGFTFTEVSIAVVLGGLIMGAVLEGKTLVDGFKQHRLIQDMISVSAAYHSYMNRYSALPGDDSNSHGWEGVTPGNRNGLIDGPGQSDGSEAHEAWQSLRFAKLITGNPGAHGKRVLPQNPYGEGYYLGHKDFGAHIGTRNCVYVKYISGRIAESIDVRYDDGLYNAGTIAASADYSSDRVELYYAL